MLAGLQNMLTHSENDELILFPIWPNNRDVNFKVNAPKNTTISGQYRDGKVIKLKVSPESRKKDIRINNNNLNNQQ